MQELFFQKKELLELPFDRPCALHIVHGIFWGSHLSNEIGTSRQNKSDFF
jgi:hypothetical protein